ncbi:arginyl-tRNA synthetase [Kitasatospora sp. MAA4]|uniref:arginine--tRNA ligase n=1 Tax=Kitasatospora sp. MAA4 TaxID=3035093 RepID=UPI002474341C|nr:arginine--tRNA ligase [Kitasatospora sp. MAA4]MDH6136752.1 arginyl-tRNA synthetase [Kitasatospora sp. MAA4]
MPAVPSLAATVHAGLQQAIGAALPDAPDCDPQLRRSDRADFQVNGLLAAAKALGANPRELAERVCAELSSRSAELAGWEVSGPGFLNLTLADSALLAQAEARLADDRLGIGQLPGAGVTVLDYSQPNIAKEMHVGHLRSTVIGDALARILSFGGERVVRRNHLGDWGTQFGMLIEYRDEFGADGADVASLDALYKTSRRHFEADPEFAERARRRVVALQAGDPPTVAAWQQIVDESKRYFEAVYQRLDVLLEDADAVGESHYNPMLADVCAELEASGVAVRSQGALCVFFDGILNPDGDPVPLIVRKKDGGYGYAASDLAAVRERVATLGADRLLYVVDSRQALHFRMVFETARRAGWLPPEVTAAHVPFGMVLGPDGRPFKTRAGGTVRLVDLLDEAVDRAAAVIAEKSPDLAPEQLAERAAQVGIGALKYADLSNARTRDYVFDLARMVSLTGDTGVYLQYAHARIHSILRKAPADAGYLAHPEVALTPAERSLALLLDECGAALAAVAESREPHRLCTYLYQLAVSFSAFYEHAPVLKAPDAATRENRLLLCRLTARTLALGLGLLGMAAPEQL